MHCSQRTMDNVGRAHLLGPRARDLEALLDGRAAARPRLDAAVQVGVESTSRVARLVCVDLGAQADAQAGEVGLQYLGTGDVEQRASVD